MRGDGTNHRNGVAMGIRTGGQLARWARSKGAVLPRHGGNRFTKAFIEKSAAWGWTPVDGEHLVKDDAAGVATGVDLVMRDAADSTILVELKCGSNGIWDAHLPGALTGPHPIPLYANSAKHHALIQLAVTRAVYARHHHIDPARVRAFVVRASNATSQWTGPVNVEGYELPGAIGAAVYAYMARG